jgi:hypothetical protein
MATVFAITINFAAREFGLMSSNVRDWIGELFGEHKSDRNLHCKSFHMPRRGTGRTVFPPVLLGMDNP